MRLRAATVLAVVALASLPARATDGLPVAFLRDAARADALVVGTVVEVRPRWTGRWVETEATIDTGDGRVRVRTIGGEVGGIGTWVPEAARFEEGRRIAVLAADGPRGLVPVSGEGSVVAMDEDAGPTDGDVLRSVEWIRRERWESSPSDR